MKERPIDGRVGSDLHVVLDHDPADLRDFFDLRAHAFEAESVGAQNDAGVEDHATADLDRALQADVGIKTAVGSDAASGIDGAMRTEHDSVANLDAVAEHTQGTNGDAAAQRDALAHNGSGVDSGFGPGGWIEAAHQRGQRDPDLGNLDPRAPGEAAILRSQQESGRATLRLLALGLARKKGDFGGSRRLKRRKTRQTLRRLVPLDERPAQPLRHFSGSRLDGWLGMERRAQSKFTLCKREGRSRRSCVAFFGSYFIPHPSPRPSHFASRSSPPVGE